MKRILREPLVHFVLLGAVLFGWYTWINEDESSSPEDIVITAGRIESLAANYAKVWQRPPSAEELKGLIDAYVQEEILSREAMKLGLDRDDTVIRRRLQQKMEFLAEDFSSVTDPTDKELADYLAEHPEKFEEEARFTFQQVYLNPEKHGEQLEADAAALLIRLRQTEGGIDATQLGDRLLLPQDYTREMRSAVTAQFGEGFAESLDALTVGEWSGPIPSGYGVHLVLLTDRTEARLPALDEVRSRVKRQLTYARREEANLQFMEKLLEKYQVIIEWPEKESAAAPGDPATTMTQ